MLYRPPVIRTFCDKFDGSRQNARKPPEKSGWGTAAADTHTARATRVGADANLRPGISVLTAHSLVPPRPLLFRRVIGCRHR